MPTLRKEEEKNQFKLIPLGCESRLKIKSLFNHRQTYFFEGTLSE
jgi:hypothetical protein